MEQYVIKTGSPEKSQNYLSHTIFGGYYYTEKAAIFDSLKDVNKAISWGKKDVAKNIKDLKKDIDIYKKEITKGNLSINKVMLDKSKKSLKEWESINFKIIKL